MKKYFLIVMMVLLLTACQKTDVQEERTIDEESEVYSETVMASESEVDSETIDDFEEESEVDLESDMDDESEVDLESEVNIILLNKSIPDTIKLEQLFRITNVESVTFLKLINISQKESVMEINFIVTKDSPSETFLNTLTLRFSINIYISTQNFEELRFRYLSNDGDQLGLMSIPKKAIKEVVNYANETGDNNYLENPYLEAFWETSNIVFN